MSDLPTIIQNLQELQRMHELNLEMLEQLSIFFQWLMENNIEIPNKDKFKSLLHKTQALMKELYSVDEPKFMQYYASRRKVTDLDDRREGNRTLSHTTYRR